MWIVMTAAAHMPSSCRGNYRKIALVEVKDIKEMPFRIDSRDSRILQIIQMGNHHFGKTARCAYQRELAAAKARCDELNSQLENA